MPLSASQNGWGGSQTHPCAEWITAFCHQIDAVLATLIPRGAVCALLSFPEHGNVGDHAIWLGTLAWLRRQEGEIVYTCGAKTYHPTQLARRLGANGIILLSGGGSFGDLWPVRQRFREMILASFPHHTIIQLPQTIRFEQEATLERARTVFSPCHNLTVLVRDSASLEVARTQLNVSSLLCPDMAFALGPLTRLSQLSIETLWLWRRSVESCGKIPLPELGDLVRDWSDGPPSSLMKLSGYCYRQLIAHPRMFSQLQRFSAWTQESLAKAHLELGCRMLDQASVVVTDRLHGHILSLLLGIPHVLLNNTYGKNKQFYETWTHACPLVRWAESPEEAKEHAAQLRINFAKRNL